MATAVNTIFPLVDSYVKRSEVADLVGGRSIALGDFPSGGSIGTAPNVIDGVSTITIAQTTASQTLTIPNPTVLTADHEFSINSIGSTSFTVLSTVLAPGSGLNVVWSNAAQGYSVIGTASGSTAVTVVGGKTFTVNNTLVLAGTDGTTMTFPSTSATVARTDAANTFTGHQTVEGVTSTGATGTGAFVFATSPTLVTPVIGVATGTSLAVTGLLKSSGTAGIGYATGAGGTVSQITSRTTGVTLSKTSGTITLVSAAGSATPFTFTVTNTLVAATDVIVVSQQSGTDVYSAVVSAVGSGTYKITITDLTGTTTETPAFNVVVIKGVAA